MAAPGLIDLGDVQLRHKYVVGIKSGIVKPRAVWLMLEHERMHLETLCYMRAQARKKSFDCQAVASANGFHSSGHVDSSSSEACESQLPHASTSCSQEVAACSL